jgi:hypothetical protein
VPGQLAPDDPPASAAVDASSVAAYGPPEAAQAETEKGRGAARDFLAHHPDPESLMKAIRDGEIPAEVLDSPAGLLLVQQRLLEINRMNELMTNMLKQMGDMEMAIVRNIRG